MQILPPAAKGPTEKPSCQHIFKPWRIRFEQGVIVETRYCIRCGKVETARGGKVTKEEK